MADNDIDITSMVVQPQDKPKAVPEQAPWTSDGPPDERFGDEGPQPLTGGPIPIPDTTTYGTETPSRHSPPTNYTSESQWDDPGTPPTAPGVAAADAVAVLDQAKHDAWEALLDAGDQPPAGDDLDEPTVLGATADDGTITARDSIDLDDDDDDDDEWVEDEKATPRKKPAGRKPARRR